MKTRSAKAKGKLLANHVVSRLCTLLGLSASDVKSPPTSVKGEDLWFADIARKKFPFSVECKNVKTLSIIAALEQSRANSNGYTPCVCYKPPGKGLDKTVIAFDLDEFLIMWNERKK